MIEEHKSKACPEYKAVSIVVSPALCLRTKSSNASQKLGKFDNDKVLHVLFHTSIIPVWIGVNGWNGVYQVL